MAQTAQAGRPPATDGGKVLFLYEEWSPAAKADAIESVRRLHEAGVTMLTGTDAGNWGVIQGYSVHRELVRLVEAGLSPWDALAASTTNAAEFLGKNMGAVTRAACALFPHSASAMSYALLFGLPILGNRSASAG